MRILTTVLAASTLFFASCNKFEKTKSGMPYKIIKGNAKEKLKQGQMIAIHVEYKLKDSVLNNTFGHIPIYFAIDTARFGKYNFAELITKCGVGDKVEFRLSIDTLKKMGQLEYNKDFKRGDYINGKVEFLKSFATENEMKDDYTKQIEAEKQRELKDVKEYAAKKNYKTEITPGGVSVVIDNAGQGPRLDSGKLAKIFYKGTLLSNGKEFDSNIKNGVKGEPLPVVVGTGGVILGWDEGLKLFAKGGKGKLIIPAMMAYGMQGAGAAIPPYANLIFEIEVADVTDAPTPQAAKPDLVTPMPAEPKKDVKKK
jgi:FKBP-type peptidyl-prolyl cis-trans isomerase FkpA